MKVVLSSAIRQRMLTQLEGTFPNEGGGFIFGVREGDVITVREVTQVQNVFPEEEQYHRYLVTPKDYMRLEDQADALGLLLAGYYHSHPDSPAVPSAYDLDVAVNAGLPDFLWLIARVQDGRGEEVRAWWLRQDKSQFDELEFVAEETL